MATTNSAVIEVNERDWATAVLERSTEVPVVVDFWAPWCGPCRVLGPVLERLADEGAGAFVLAKINVDHNQRLAAQYGIQGIPAVKAFRDGKVVDEFTGALPESQVRSWLKKLVPAKADVMAAQAAQIERNDLSAAEDLYRKALRHDPEHGPSRLGLGRVLALQGDPAAAETLRGVKAGTPEYPAAQALLEFADFVAAAPAELQQARDELGSNPNDSGARYRLAAALARGQQWEDALRHLLAIVQRDRAYGDDAARRAMLAIFAVLGEKDLTVSQYRRQLASALF